MSIQHLSKDRAPPYLSRTSDQRIRDTDTLHGHEPAVSQLRHLHNVCTGTYFSTLTYLGMLVCATDHMSAYRGIPTSRCAST